MKEYEDIDEAYVDALNYLFKYGQTVNSVLDSNSVGSNFGKSVRKFKETLGYSFTILNPRARILSNTHRKASLGFSIANFLWVLNGKRDVESISFYNNKGKKFSNDRKYYESAFGSRIFTDNSLWIKALTLLQEDPTTRRALIPVFIPKDLLNRPLDTPCVSHIQLLIRENKLDMILNMRSQSVAMVFPYDIFLFSMLQEYFSLRLNIPLGKLIYFCASFHYYLDEESLVKKVIEEKQRFRSIKMPLMKDVNDLQLKKIEYTEYAIRKSVLKKDIEPQFSEFDDYWGELLKALLIKSRLDKSQQDIEHIKFNYLDKNLI